MGMIRKTGLVKALEYGQWSGLLVAGAIGACALILWQDSPLPVDSARPTTQSLMRSSFLELDTNCRQEQQQPLSRDNCEGMCAEESLDHAALHEDSTDFGWSILTCTNMEHFPSAGVHQDGSATMRIEVVRSSRRF